MDKHICRQCKKLFNYCRACVFKPIPWKEAGFCSAECSAEFKRPKIEEVIPVEDVEVVVIEEDTSTPKEDAIEYPYFFTTTEEDVIEIKEENEIDDNEQNYGEDV